MKKKKIMFWCSLSLLILLKAFAIYKGTLFGIFPKSYDIFTFLWVIFGMYGFYFLSKFGKKKKSLYDSFVVGCIIGINSSSEGSLEKILHTLGMVSLLMFIVSFISLKKNHSYS